jgi:hypothetical protein
MAIISGGQVIEGARERMFLNAGAPLSGSTNGTLRDAAPPTALLRDTTNDVLYVNEGTLASPYWTPVSYDQHGLLGWHSDFRDGVGKAIADTANSVVLAGSGFRVHGQGIEEADSGLTIAHTAELGPLASLIATNQDAHLAAIGLGDTTLPFQPDVNGPMVIDVLVSNLTDILTRAFFLGFIGAAADLLDPVVTSVTTTITLVLDDLAGLIMDSQLTDAAGLMAPHNKSNEAATLEVSATGVDTGTDMAAAGTYQRFRVEISAAGVMTCFADKVQIASIAASLDADEEVAPVLYLESTDANTKTLNVKRIAVYATRV